MLIMSIFTKCKCKCKCKIFKCISDHLSYFYIKHIKSYPEPDFYAYPTQEYGKVDPLWKYL